MKIQTLLGWAAMSLFVLAGCQTQAGVVEPETSTIEFPASAEVFAIDSAQSSASYIISETFFGDSESNLGRKVTTGDYVATGTTPEVSGEIGLLMDQEALTGAAGYITANLNLLASEQPHRDGMLKQYWLVSNDFPIAYFEITEAVGLPNEVIEGEAAAFDLIGQLTIRDQTREVTFSTTAFLEDGILSGEATTTLMMSDFGIEPPSVVNAVVVEDQFEIVIQLVANATP